jgi:hypothetical protein
MDNVQKTNNFINMLSSKLSVADLRKPITYGRLRWFESVDGSLK